MTTHIALLRGVNVGRAGRVAMADLRRIVTGLGYANVRTVLNSGNIVFEAPRKMTALSLATMRRAIGEKTRLTSAIVVLSAADLAAIISENPLDCAARSPSRFLVAFPSASADLAKAAALLEDDWALDQLALGPKAAYLWCPGGIHASKLVKALDRALGSSVTMRNWATALRLDALSRLAQPQPAV